MFDTILEKLGLSFARKTEPDNRSEELIAESIQKNSIGAFVLLKCLMELQTEGIMDMEFFERSLNPHMVTIAKNLNEAEIEKASYQVTEGLDINFDREFGWVRFLNRALMVANDHPEDELPEHDFEVPEQLFTQDYDKAFHYLGDMLYTAFLEFSGYEESEMPYTLIHEIVRHAEENNMVDGHKFSEWFPQARALLDNDTYDCAMTN